MAASDRPTAKQLRYLRALADQTGTTFTPPTTRGEASQAIDALGRGPVEGRSDRRRQRRQVSVDLTEARPDSSVRGDEVSGYGGGARWR